MKKYTFLKMTLISGFAMATGLITGCQKNLVEEAASQNAWVPTTVAAKQIEVPTAEGKTIVMEVSASDQALLDLVSPKHFAADLNNVTVAVDEAHSETKQLAPDPQMPTRYLSIHVLGADIEGGMETYTIHFSDAFQAIMRREQAGMHINLQPSTQDPAGRTSGWWARTPYCSKVTCYGDGGAIPTGVITYRPTNVGQSPVHQFYFFNSASCTKCAHNVNALDDIWVFQDVLSSFTWSFSC
jgi:hypothetical protein